MSEKYILEGHTPVKCEDVMTWATWFEKADRVVGKTKIGEVEVSTVFIGLNHRFDGGEPPLLFETMVFGGEDDQDMRRYSSWVEAEMGHFAMVKKEERRLSRSEESATAPPLKRKSYRNVRFNLTG